MLKRSLYGLKQSARTWNKTFCSALASLGLKATASDPCLYTTAAGDLIFALYVDDGIMAATTEKTLSKAVTLLQQRFKVTVGRLNTFVGMQVERLSDGKMKLHQSAYVSRILT